MINIKAIQSGLNTLVGFEQNTNPDYPELDEELLTSDSGLIVQRIHPLLTIKNISDCLKIGPEEFSDFLISKRQASIANLINRVYAEKQLSEVGKEVISDIRLYDGTGNFNDKVVNQDRFVGFKVSMKEEDLTIITRMIGLQFDKAKADLKIYVYHSSQSEPVKVLTLNYDKPSSFIWKNFDKLELPFIKGGSYLIGYYESDIEGQAINREQSFSRIPSCNSCNPVNYNYYVKWFKYLRVQPFYVNPEYLNDDKTKWNESEEIYVDSTNFGLNLSLSVVCDASALLLRVREVFADALSQQIAVDLLKEMAYSTRDNQVQNKVSQMAMYALNDEENKEGMETKLSKSIKALSFNISNLNPVCLPCNDNAQRLNFKTVF